MTNRIGDLRAALLIGVAACVLALPGTAAAQTHMQGGWTGGHMTSPPPTPPPSSPPQSPTMGHGGDHLGSHDHHHHDHVVFIHDPFWYDPFWYPYPYRVETRYVEVPASDGYWYYCPDSKSYYPYVKECASKWERVPPKPPSE